MPFHTYDLAHDHFDPEEIFPHAFPFLRVDLPTISRTKYFQHAARMTMMFPDRMSRQMLGMGEGVVLPKSTIVSMVDHICAQFDQLEVARRYMVVKWLQGHSPAVRGYREMRENLAAWLESMPAEHAGREYKLILGETNWWRDLEERRFAQIMLESIDLQP